MPTCKSAGFYGCKPHDWTNGGFETGDFNEWEIISGSPSIQQWSPYDGVYFCTLDSGGSIRHYFNGIDTNKIIACYLAYWGTHSHSPAYTGHIEVKIQYTDETDTIIQFAGTDWWNMCNICPYIEPNKRIFFIQITSEDGWMSPNHIDCCVLRTSGTYSKWHLYVGGSEKEWTNIQFRKQHPSEDPDTFSATLAGKVDDILNYFDVVKIYKEDSTGTEKLKFYGYLETIEVASSGNGIVTVISGRCRKIILWKKFTERFQDAKLDGFFGRVHPHELFKFLLRCPISEVPDETESWTERDYSLCKIGWGMNPRDWSCYASATSIGTHPQYPTFRTQDFYWRNRGINDAQVGLKANGEEGDNDWSENGASGHDCVENEKDGKNISTTGNGHSYDFTFENLPASASGVNKVKVRVRFGVDFITSPNTVVKVTLQMYDGSGWNNIGDMTYSANSSVGFCIHSGGPIYKNQPLDYDVTWFLNTVQKVNNAKVRFVRIQGDSQISAIVDCVQLTVNYSSGAFQAIGEWYKIDLGSSQERVCGILLQSRNHYDQFPRHYKVQVGNEDESLCGNQNAGSVAYAMPTGHVVIVGPWTMPQSDFIRGIYVYLEGTGSKIKGVIYKKVDGVPNSLDLVAIGEQITILENKAHWEFLPIECFLNSGDIFYMGYCEDAGNTTTMYANSADIDALNVQLPVNAWHFVHNDFTHVNTEPWLHDNDQGVNANRITDAAMEEYMGDYDEYYTFQNLDPKYQAFTYGTYVRLHLVAKLYQGGSGWAGGVTLGIKIFDGTSWHTHSIHKGWWEHTYTDKYWDIPASWLNTPSKVNNARLIIELTGLTSPYGAGYGGIDITYAYLEVIGSAKYNAYELYHKTANCNPPDPFGAPAESASYEKWSIFMAYGGDYETVATVPNNCAQDILHSWKPRNVRYIKMFLTQSHAPNGWVITQVYVYKADDIAYTVLDEESWKQIYQYLTLGTIQEHIDCDEETGLCLSCLEPMNVPYGRLIEALNKITSYTHDNYVPWEWWITLTDTVTAPINFGTMKGSDKSATVKFRGSIELGESSMITSVKSTAQRVKCVGSKSGKRQDTITSNWQIDEIAMGVAGTFYEDISNDRTIANRDIAQEWAKLRKELTKSPVSDFTINVEDFPEVEDWDTGDIVNVVDTKTGILDGDYRVKGVDYRISSDSGERLLLVVAPYDAPKRSIEGFVDRIAELYRRVTIMEISNIDVEEWASETTTQQAIDTSKLDNPWSITRKYNATTELQDIDPNDNSTYMILHKQNLGHCSACSGKITIKKDNLSIQGNWQGPYSGEDPCTESATIRCHVLQRLTSWKHDPRFKARFQVTRDFPCTTDYLYFGIGKCVDGSTYGIPLTTTRGFGFKIIKELVDGVPTLVLYAWVKDMEGVTLRACEYIATGQLYEVEAKVDGTEGYVYFYLNDMPKAIIPLSDDTENRDMSLMAMMMMAKCYHSSSALVEFFDWSTQVKVFATEQY